ncbi:MAG: DUF45 domain-containing protein [Bacteroidetes bacterium]|nr:DUF45 domain-containing protein [Bacteroidota bacterium]
MGLLQLGEKHHYLDPPAPVFEYILVHELCHLKEMNHSPAYWRLVASIDPDYKEKEQWLKAHGHRIKF